MTVGYPNTGSFTLSLHFITPGLQSAVCKCHTPIFLLTRGVLWGVCSCEFGVPREDLKNVRPKSDVKKLVFLSFFSYVSDNVQHTVLVTLMSEYRRFLLPF